MDISDYSIYLIEMTECGSVLDGHIIPGEPLVSVSVITYNHGKYVRQCLDGILMQKVNFPYEVLIHDDASPDDTADIIREYEARFPTVIKPIYQTENQYSQGKSISKFNFDRAKGKYIAQCEGDDYWTDSRKLQMQVDFLEEHEEYVGTAHNCKTIDERGIEISETAYFPSTMNYCFTIKNVELYQLPGQTATLVFRNIFKVITKNEIECYYQIPFLGDRKLVLLLTLYGNIYCFKDIWSNYRYITHGTSWAARSAGKYMEDAVIKQLRDLIYFAQLYHGYKFKPYRMLISSVTATIRYLITKHNWSAVSNVLSWSRLILTEPILLKNYIVLLLAFPLSVIVVLLKVHATPWTIGMYTKRQK